MTANAKRTTEPALHVAAGEAALSPTQQAAFTRLDAAVEISPVIAFEGPAGSGKSTIVQRLIAARGGARVGCRDILRASAGSAHPGVEEHIHALMEDAFREHDLVVLEDLDMVFTYSIGAQGYVRQGYVNVLLRTLMDYVRRTPAKRLVFSAGTFWPSGENSLSPILTDRSQGVEIASFTPNDYTFFLGLRLGEQAKTINATRLHEYTPNLSVYQLNLLAGLIQKRGQTDENALRDMLDGAVLSTNTNIGEVADIKFSDLKGFEGIVDQLTTFVLNPLRFDERFDNLGLTPKRGVLLFGPPGTGKTSIGRALAHHMRGKFFLIDGTFTTEPPAGFYFRVKRVFEAAKKATPSVIFIDDADVLFQSDRSTGLHRYLLSMLDGLESATAGKVAVIMTAMDPNHLPLSLLRSGRVELWIETRPPPMGARREIVAAHLAGLPEFFRKYDADRVEAATEGFSAADMKRLIADVKALYARDVLDDRKPKTMDEYFELAAAGVAQNKRMLRLAASGQIEPGASAEAAKRSRGRKEDEEENSCG